MWPGLKLLTPHSVTLILAHSMRLLPCDAVPLPSTIHVPMATDNTLMLVTVIIYWWQADLGAAAGPVIGYTVLQLQLPSSTILLTQATLHAIAAFVSCCPCSDYALSGRHRLH